MNRFKIAFEECCAKAQALYPQFIAPQLDFNATGQAAGWARWNTTTGIYRVSLNKTFCLAVPQDMLEDTIPHEVAHILAVQRYGKEVRAHGKEWIAMFGALTGRVPSRCHDYGREEVAAQSVAKKLTTTAEQMLADLLQGDLK